MKPLLVRGGLSGAVYVVTRYKVSPDGLITAQTKYDVTDQFVKVALELDEDWWNAKTEEAQGA